MKPYKIIHSQNPLSKRVIIVNGAKPPKKIPLRIFLDVHPPKRLFNFVEVNNHE